MWWCQVDVCWWSTNTLPRPNHVCVRCHGIPTYALSWSTWFPVRAKLASVRVVWGHWSCSYRPFIISSITMTTTMALSHTYRCQDVNCLVILCCLPLTHHLHYVWKLIFPLVPRSLYMQTPSFPLLSIFSLYYSYIGHRSLKPTPTFRIITHCATLFFL